MVASSERVMGSVLFATMSLPPRLGATSLDSSLIAFLRCSGEIPWCSTAAWLGVMSGVGSLHLGCFACSWARISFSMMLLRPYEHNNLRALEHLFLESYSRAMFTVIRCYWPDNQCSILL
eukprot:1145476-Ditylum_brightwellii.AAC.1